MTPSRALTGRRTQRAVKRPACLCSIAQAGGWSERYAQLLASVDLQSDVTLL